MDSINPAPARLCEYCGTEIAPNTKFCQDCGKPVPVATVVAPTQPAAPDAPPQRDAFPLSIGEGDANEQGFTRTAAASAGTAAPAVPQAWMIGAYRVLRELGRGGMGVVYLAVRDDGAFRKNVALKLLLRDRVTAEFISRFKQERQVLAALDHPHIARILDGGDTPEGMPYYVMEYVEGLPLDRYCDQARLTLSGRIKIFQQVCLAVDYLHDNSILHRDLKPSNILVSSDGVVKLLDFGIAKVVGAGSFANPDLTGAQGRPMTPTYASPEQLSGATLHKTSDLYSLGAILYTLLTGRPAYNDLEDKVAKLAAREIPSRPSANIREDLRSAETTAQFRRAMLGELDSIVLMTMQIDAKDRYQSAADLAKDLQHFLDGSPVTAHHTSTAVRSVKLLKRKSAVIAVLCAFLVVAAFGAWEWMRLDHQRSEAAAREARLSALIDNLERRTNKGPADVQKLKAAFQADFPAISNDDALLAKGIKYLDHVRATAPANPDLNAQVGDAYQQLGSLQAKGPQSPNGSRAALATYEKAATTLANAAPPDPRGADRVKQNLATVNARIRALGGTPVPLAVTPAPKDEAARSQAAQTTQPPKTGALRPPAPSHSTAPSVQPPATAAKDEPPPISADTEDRLVAVTSKVEITDQTYAPIRQNLANTGESLNADALTRLARMHASLERAKRAIAAGNEADAKDSLAAAESLADKLLHSVGR